MQDTVWLVDPKTRELVSPYEELKGTKRILAAQPFTVSLVSTVVAEDLDCIFRGNNDLMVISRSAMGEQPLVERIHYYEEEVPAGFPIRNLLADNVFIADDYNGLDKLWLELNVLEIDTDTGERKAAVQAFQSLAAVAGAVFPVILPYAFAATAVVGVLEKIVTAFEKNEDVIKIPFSLYPGEPRTGRAPFQVGTYVAFAKPEAGEGCKLQTNGLLTSAKVASKLSYIVFDIAPIKQPSPKFVMSQKVATLLTQIQKGNPNSTLSTIEFLTDTVTQYNNFKKLNRYLELKSIEEPSVDEKTLMADIAKIEVLKPFLPSK